MMASGVFLDHHRWVKQRLGETLEGQRNPQIVLSDFRSLVWQAQVLWEETQAAIHTLEATYSPHPSELVIPVEDSEPAVPRVIRKKRKETPRRA